MARMLKSVGSVVMWLYWKRRESDETEHRLYALLWQGVCFAEV